MIEIVNGFVCNNCTDVEYAKNNIDPAKPKDGPVDQGPAFEPAVKFGGALAGTDEPASATPPSRKLDIHI